MQNILNYLSLIRVANCLLAAAAVMIGGYLADSILFSGPLCLAALAAFLVCAAGNAHNDLVDLEIDTINRPDRVLPQGRLSPSDAWVVAIVSALGAVGLAVFVNLWVVVTVAGSLILLALYNRYLKKLPLVGNLSIALLSGLTFLVGGMASDPYLLWILPGPLIPAVFALLFHLVREMLKDCDDVRGDGRRGVTTLPQLIGLRKAAGVALALFFLLVLLTYVPVYFGWFSRAYEVITIYLVDLPLLGLLIFVWGNPSQRLLRIGSFALKIGMLLGLLALLIADQQK